MKYLRRKLDVDLILTVALDEDDGPLDEAFNDAILQYEIKINELGGVSVEGGRGFIRAHIKGKGEEISI